MHFEINYAIKSECVLSKHLEQFVASSASMMSISHQVIPTSIPET